MNFDWISPEGPATETKYLEPCSAARRCCDSDNLFDDPKIEVFCVTFGASGCIPLMNPSDSKEG